MGGEGHGSLQDAIMIIDGQRFPDAKISLEIGNSASDEILLIYSTANAFYRQKKVGAIQSLVELVKRRDVKVRILTPKKELIENTVQMHPSKFSICSKMHGQLRLD